MDVVGPILAGKTKNVFIITMIDRFTRFVEAAVVTNHKAHTIKVTCFNHWVSRYGPPVVLITDNGAEFQIARI